MNKSAIQIWIEAGEGLQTEFKTSFGPEVIESLAAFTNTSGGRVFIGVSDSGAVSGVTTQPESAQQWVNEIKTKTSPSIIPDIEWYEVDGKNIVVLSIQEHPVKPVAVRGKYYKRVGNANHLISTSEVVNMHLRSFNTSWDYQISLQHNLDDISLDKVQKAIDQANAVHKNITEDPITFLMKSDLLRNGELTYAAYLLFHKNEAVVANIELGRFQDDITIKDSDRSQSDLLTQTEEVMAFVKKHIHKEIVISGQIQHQEKWQYPPEALREIILNMIIHRDYRSSADSVVKIYDHKIEFYNPGKLPESISIQDLLSNHCTSSPRNKLIADFCKSIGIIEKYGSGIRRILHATQTHGLPQPLFQQITDGFMVTIFDAQYSATQNDISKGGTGFFKNIKNFFASF